MIEVRDETVGVIVQVFAKMFGVIVQVIASVPSLPNHRAAIAPVVKINMGSRSDRKICLLCKLIESGVHADHGPSAACMGHGIEHR